MKIRSGFVSNSSSSSFCLYGASLSKSDLKTFVQTISDSDIEKFIKEHKYYDMNSFGRPKDSTQDPDDYDEEFDMSAIAEFIDEFYSPNVSLSNAADYECDTLYLGRESSDIGDDETGRQFRESVDFLAKLFPGVDIGWHEGEISC